jgi:hypothetical protein
MKRRLLVPVIFSLAVGAWAALLWPAPATPPVYAFRVRLEVGAGPRGTDSPDAILDDLQRGPGVQDQLWALLRGRPGVPDKLNAMFQDPVFLAGLRESDLFFLTDAPDPLPPDWYSSWASLEVEPAAGPRRYIDLVLKGDDPERLRLVARQSAEYLERELWHLHGLRIRGIGPKTWDPLHDPVTPRRRRLSLSLSCLALAAAVGVGVWRQGRRPRGDAPLPAPPAAPAPCGVHDFPPPEITAGEPTT